MANPSESQPQLPTFEDNIELSKAEAVAECKGIIDTVLANSTGSLEEHEGYLRREKRAAGVDCEDATPARLDGAETTDGEVGGRWLRLR